MPLVRKEKVTTIRITVIHAVGGEICLGAGGGLRNVLRKIGWVLDRRRNTVWIITRQESLSSDRELSYLWSPVSIKAYLWIKQCLWIKGWFGPNCSLYKECLGRVNRPQIKGRQKCPWLGADILVHNEPWRGVSENCSQNICGGTKNVWPIPWGIGQDM